ncbi:hypothetical protein [uncultured Alistipes sp.]|uniref:hypothetical protein n=1 Tax=uncultured Alistipes sp. TaxID=538949 RepID=UPI00262E5DA3|nr:hypothetical protein [uncultured Alistipes sp.]
MNELTICMLKGCRKIYNRFNGRQRKQPLGQEYNPDKAAEIIYNHLSGVKPCMIARFGSTELMTIVNYLGVKNHRRSILGYIKGTAPAWWWEKSALEQMQRWSGFFPPTEKNIEQFCQLMIEDTKQVDVLGSWLSDEQYLNQELSQAESICFTFLDPFWSHSPWTQALKDKKILVVHPFAETIRQQYKKRELLFKNPNILPPFELYTLKAVQSLGGESNGFKDWFEALYYMKAEMDKIDYDICLLGCGAYGFPLAAHAKRQGKKAVHIGGKLQLLFGIKGQRWENPNYSNTYDFTQFMNEYWVRPSPEEKPQSADEVENACYW